MALTNRQKVRLSISDKLSIARQTSTSDGESTVFKLGNEVICTDPAPSVWVDGVQLTETTDYTVNYDHGIISLVATPAVNDKIIFQYYWSIFSDDEIDQFLLDSNDNVQIASARALFAWAADVSKVAKRMTMSGGGGLGQVVQDTSVAAKELRQTAKDLIEMQAKLGEVDPYDGITEVVWNEFGYERGVEQDFLRSN